MPIVVIAVPAMPMTPMPVSIFVAIRPSVLVAVAVSMLPLAFFLAALAFCFFGGEGLFEIIEAVVLAGVHF